ncbi:MAG TPA: hypothetical protein VEK08_24515 [Planctomycetota bacterium]|nr:hypothetical protein [Planctomycetota bacterium]
MFAPEDVELLGTPAQNGTRMRRPSSVSQILRVISDDLEHGRRDLDVGKQADEPPIHVLVAADRQTRRRAYQLAHRVYSGRGYASDSDGLIVSPYDADPRTFTLLVVDDRGRDAATITLVFDSDKRLPSDEIYGGELDALRAQGRRLAEVTRLAISEEHQRYKSLLVRLFDFVYVFARPVKGYDDFVIEVNPRHVQYYRRLLAFEVAGPERPCPRVQGAPAVLLRLDLAHGENCLRQSRANPGACGRSLFSSMCSWIEEGAIAEFLCRSHKPMSADDADYFGLQPFGNVQAQAPMLAAGQ